jgi:hypothetical protein
MGKQVLWYHISVIATANKNSISGLSKAGE